MPTYETVCFVDMVSNGAPRQITLLDPRIQSIYRQIEGELVRLVMS